MFHAFSFCLLLAGLAFADNPTVEAPEVLRQSITRIFPRHNPLELSAGDLLVLDLDNTVFREAQLLGTDDWYSYAEHQLREQGLSFEQAEERLHDLNRKIKTATRMELMEPEMAEWIRSMQKSRVNVIGITARHPEFAELTIKQLQSFGIQFNPSAFSEETLKDLHVPGSIRPRPFYKSGIAFVRNEAKGHVLRAMLELAQYRPNRVLAIDDRIHHIHSFWEALTELKIAGLVIHYLKALEVPPFDPKIVEWQKKYFEATGQLLSDERARRDCELQLSEEEQRHYRNPDHFVP